MNLEWDEPKRLATLDLRGLDFAHADRLFAGASLTVEDDRQDYGEIRYQTIGQIEAEVVMVVWTPRVDKRRIISMRRCDDKERERFWTFTSRR